MPTINMSSLHASLGYSHISLNSQLAISKSQLNEIKSSQFRTHRQAIDERIDQFAQMLLSPWKLSLRLLASVIQPAPGADKERGMLNAVRRASCLAGAFLSLPFALVSLTMGLPLHVYSHVRRPSLSFIDFSHLSQAQPSSNQNELHIRTHNLGFVYEFFGIVGDLRPVKERAHEVAQHLLNDPHQPDMICFQEAFHIDGTRLLCEEIKRVYPYMIHSVAPHGLGLNNGCIIASKYPIKHFSVRLFKNLIGPEGWSPRGLLRATIEKDGKEIAVYSAHLQALLGKERAAARVEQAKHIVRWIKEDRARDPFIPQILVGDFNASKITAWGEINPTEAAFFEEMEKHFTDVFALDHDELGNRTAGSPRFLESDEARMIRPATGIPRAEPAGSWYVGPFAKKNLVLRLKSAWEAFWNGSSDYVPHPAIQKEESVLWGTRKWASGPQTANTARFDGAWVPKDQLGQEGDINSARAEIRRVVTDRQSAPTDHLPMDVVVAL
ncbi:endonuclease/exonuclease/phosphatase family protein [Candidatus Protochlamydia phocaeensis]|uniref:endonuclease/exonuclease/phosphatase family protein n=1 Tax=Candidatus Protochlamydia phocaeensis TaxID=1414722 RepID=UPI00083921F4|nr:endonuclease/exonuclease/phosphatase family protein [Candidatus Protochlamydia phocaeensis]